MEAVITERRSSNIFIRDVRLKEKGDAIPSHCHNYDHTMFFMKGTGLVTTTRADGSKCEKTITAPDDVLVEKGTLHDVEALTDDVYFCCVFPHRDLQGNVADEPATRDAYL